MEVPVGSTFSVDEQRSLSTVSDRWGWVVRADGWLVGHGLPPLRLLLTVVTTSALSVFPSYYFAIVNVDGVMYKQFLNDTFYNHFGIELCEHDYENASQSDCGGPGTAPMSLWFGFTVSVFYVGSLMGSLSIPPLADRLGRRSVLMLWNSIMSVLGALLMAFCWFRSWDNTVTYFQSFAMLIIGRMVCGFACGISNGLLPLYLTEISPTQYRGFNGCCQNVALSVNSLFALLVGQALAHHWFWLHIIPLPFALVLAALAACFPETPKYLLLHKHNTIAARAALTFFLPDITDQQVVEVFMHYRSEELQAATYQTSIKDVIVLRHLRKPILISASVMLASMSTGIVVIFTYSTEMFTSQAGMSERAASACSVLLAIFNCAGALIGCALVDRVGRRLMVLVGLVGCTVCDLLFLATNISFHELTAGSNDTRQFSWIGMVGVAVMMVHVTMFNVGPGAVQWFIVAEMTPQSIRSIGVMTTLLVNNLSLIFFNFGYPPLHVLLGPYIFFMFILPVTLLTVYIYFELPETRNREINDIIRQWRPERTTTRKNFYINSAFTLRRRE